MTPQATNSHRRRLTQHASGKKALVLLAFTGKREIWVVESTDAASIERLDVPRLDQGHESSVDVELERLAERTFGARPWSVYPLQAVRRVADTAFFGAWLPQALVGDPTPRARCVPLTRGQVPSIVEKALGASLACPDVSPPSRVLRTILHLHQQGFGQLTAVTSPECNVGWTLEVIPMALLQPTGELAESWRRSLVGLPETPPTLTPRLLQEWRDQLAAAGCRPLVHQGGSNPELFGIGVDPAAVAREIGGRFPHVCWAGYGRPDARTEWIRVAAERAPTWGPPRATWREGESVGFPWSTQTIENRWMP